MLNTLRRRMANEDEGFTLIELMVVVLIIAILMAIAIPTFLGAQDRARDRGAQSNLRNGLQAAKTIATDNSGMFLDTSATPVAIDATDMATAEAALVFTGASATVDSSVGSILVTTATDGSAIYLINKSASNTYFCVAALSNGKVGYGKSTAANAAAAVTAFGAATTAAQTSIAAGCASPKW